LLRKAGHGDAAIDALFARMPAESFLRERPEQLAWQADALAGHAPGETVARARALVEGDAHALRVFVHSPDRDGLFAAIVATLDRLGLAIQHARLLDGPDATVFDTFVVLPNDPLRPVAPADAESRLVAVLAGALDKVRPARRSTPRHLRHFRIAPQVQFADSADGRRSVLSLVCTDRPGLLADVAQVLRAHRVRVHDARIATFGERAEDVFRITDEQDRPLSAAPKQALHDALVARIDGEPKA
jgi:[protein-PII] uridylyltransferase